jgi:hypothetical protein
MCMHMPMYVTCEHDMCTDVHAHDAHAHVHVVMCMCKFLILNSTHTSPSTAHGRTTLKPYRAKALISVLRFLNRVESQPTKIESLTKSTVGARHLGTRARALSTALSCLRPCMLRAQLTLTSPHRRRRPPAWRRQW